MPGIPKACRSTVNHPQKVAQMMADIVELASRLRPSLSCGWALLKPWLPLLFRPSSFMSCPDSTPSYSVFCTFMLASHLAWHFYAVINQKQGPGADSWFPHIHACGPCRMDGPTLWIDLRGRVSSLSWLTRVGRAFLSPLIAEPDSLEVTSTWRFTRFSINIVLFAL